MSEWIKVLVIKPPVEPIGHVTEGVPAKIIGDVKYLSGDDKLLDVRRVAWEKTDFYVDPSKGFQKTDWLLQNRNLKMAAKMGRSLANESRFVAAIVNSSPNPVDLAAAFFANIFRVKDGKAPLPQILDINDPLVKEVKYAERVEDMEMREPSPYYPNNLSLSPAVSEFLFRSLNADTMSESGWEFIRRLSGQQTSGYISMIARFLPFYSGLILSAPLPVSIQSLLQATSKSTPVFPEQESLTYNLRFGRKYTDPNDYYKAIKGSEEGRVMPAKTVVEAMRRLRVAKFHPESVKNYLIAMRKNAAVRTPSENLEEAATLVRVDLKKGLKTAEDIKSALENIRATRSRMAKML